MASPIPRSDTAVAQSTGRHPPNAVSLVFGVVFSGLAACWALLHTQVLSWGDLQWALPALFTGAGVLGLACTLLRGRPSRS